MCLAARAGASLEMCGCGAEGGDDAQNYATGCAVPNDDGNKGLDVVWARRKALLPCAARRPVEGTGWTPKKESESALLLPEPAAEQRDKFNLPLHKDDVGREGQLLSLSWDKQ